MPRRLKNIRPWKGKLQAYTEIHGKTHSQTFALSTSTETMRAWIKTERDKFAKARPSAGSFGADIVDYLTRVTGMVSYQQRAAHLALWGAALGRDRPRHGITTAEIDRVLNGWIVDGFAPRTIRKRRMSFLSMWNLLDGRDAPNPVRTSQCPREPKAEARGLSYAIIQTIFDALGPSHGKLRLQVIAWTGLPPGMLGKVQKEDLNLSQKTLRVRPRRKGAGVEARTLPLLPQAVEAFRAFDAAGLYGPFSVPSLNSLFRRGCAAADPPVEGVSLYDLRHSFGTMLYRVTKDLATVARFLMHANVGMSQRYAIGAMREVDRAAADLAGKTLSQKPVRAKKHRKRNHLHV